MGPYRGEFSIREPGNKQVEEVVIVFGGYGTQTLFHFAISEEVRNVLGYGGR